MVAEADTNMDGVISMDEFVDVLANAEGKTSLWSQTQASIWQNFQRNTAQIGQVIDTTAVVMLHPLHNISRQNSYQFKDVRVATVGLRICTFLVALMIGVVTAPLLLINCLLILVNLFTMIGYGCTTEMYIMGLRLVDLDTRRPFTFLGIFGFMVLYFIFAFFTEWWLLLFTGRTLSERIMNAKNLYYLSFYPVQWPSLPMHRSSTSGL